MAKPFDLDDYVKEVSDYVKRNNLINPIVIAHSFGGRIAIKLESTSPTFSKMILTGSAGIKPRFSLKKFFKKFLFKVLSLFIKKEKLVRFYSKDYQSLPKTNRISFIKIVNEYLDNRLDKITCPTLLVFGENDKETPIYMAKKLHKKIKNSQLKIILKAGHFCFLDRPKEFIDLAKEFLL